MLRWLGGWVCGCGLLEVEGRLEGAGWGEERVRRWEEGIRRLEGGEPVQYVIGETDFAGLTLKCDRRALIPRPETELLVEEAERCARECGWGEEGVRVVDTCTGSGCVAVALAARHKGWRVKGVDVDAAALSLARENGVAARVAVEWALGDLLAGEAAESAELVTANPPYVTTAEWRGLERRVRDFEPRLALDGGEEGLDAISRLVREAGSVLRYGGRLVMEIGESQGDAVEGLICQTNEMRMVRRLRDYGGRERLVVAERRRR